MLQLNKEEEVIFMMNSRYIKSILTVLLCSIVLTGSSLYTDRASAQQDVLPAKAVTCTSGEQITKPLAVVNSPTLYLSKKITMNAKFDKFSTLGLDYKPAYKSSDNYISFLIKRDDTNFDIPLSEMKLFLQRETAEKFIDLKTNDEIKITGTVFSDALGDAWIDVENIEIIKKAPEKDGVEQ